MRYLVTGSSGFIGTPLVKALREKPDSEVFEWDREHGDLKEDGNTFPDVDVIVHLAGFNSTKNFYDMSFDVIMDNMLSTLYVLKYYREKYEGREDKPLFVYAGTPECATGAVEDFGYPIPTDEACPLVVPDPTNTRWSYAGSKGLGEQAAICSGLPWIVFRPNNIYGPRQKNHFVPEFIERVVLENDYSIYGWENTRSWLYIDDCVDALVRLIHTEEAKGEIVNIGSNDETEVITLAEIMLEHLGIDKNLIIKNDAPVGSANRRMPDISKLKKLTGWEPTTNLHDGLKVTVEYEKNKLLG